MQTNLADFIRDTDDGRDADAILRKCVHCGFCTATCPTYQILGDELDGPRGRIYLMKQVLEGAPVTDKTQLHLDRCLTCRSCETTCPSGVHYSRLLDIGRRVVEERVRRGPADAIARAALNTIVPRPALFRMLVGAGRLARPLLPERLRAKLVWKVRPAPPRPAMTHARRMLVLEGCVQPVLSPATNAAAARVLDRLGITLTAAQGAGCCGAVSYHLTREDDARDYIRRNVDAWWPHVEAGAEAVVITASGCGTMVKDYGHHLDRDRAYAEKARRISEITKDISEVVLDRADELRALIPQASSPIRRKIAFHPPCTLQHGLKIRGDIERLLLDLGFDLAPVRDAHLCCGSAGTYSLLHPELADRLRDDKIAALTAGEPAEIVTANIGCQTHLQGATDKPVRHWIELVDEALSTPR